jgi:hypothetical protein
VGLSKREQVSRYQLKRNLAEVKSSREKDFNLQGDNRRLVIEAEKLDKLHYAIVSQLARFLSRVGRWVVYFILQTFYF